MITTVKDICLEALNRTNLVPRKRSVPADMMESAKRLFDGIINSYNFSNFINFSRDKVDFKAEEKIEIEGDYASIATVMYKVNRDVNDEMRFVAYEQFFTDPDTFTYTWKPTLDGKIELYFKHNFVQQNRTVSVLLNNEITWNLDDELRIPSIYLELFTNALVVKLAMTYPRVDQTKVANWKNELLDVEGKVKAMVSSNKILTRNVATMSDLASLISGSFIKV